MEIYHHNEIPEYLQKRINEEIEKILEDYNKKHHTNLCLVSRHNFVKLLAAWRHKLMPRTTTEEMWSFMTKFFE